MDRQENNNTSSTEPHHRLVEVYATPDLSQAHHAIAILDKADIPASIEHEILAGFSAYMGIDNNASVMVLDHQYDKAIQLLQEAGLIPKAGEESQASDEWYVQNAPYSFRRGSLARCLLLLLLFIFAMGVILYCYHHFPAQ